MLTEAYQNFMQRCYAGVAVLCSLLCSAPLHWSVI